MAALSLTIFQTPGSCATRPILDFTGVTAARLQMRCIPFVFIQAELYDRTHPITTTIHNPSIPVPTADRIPLPLASMTTLVQDVNEASPS